MDAVRGVPGVLTEPAPAVFLGSLAAQYVEMEVNFWINTLDQEIGLQQVLSAAQERTRRTLMDNGFTVSANVTNSLKLKAEHIGVKLENNSAL